MITELIAKVFHTRNAVHIEHWRTLNQARHEATGVFYDAVIDSLDPLVETWIATFGELAEADLTAEAIDDLDEHLKEEADWIEVNRGEISADSDAIANLVDALVKVYRDLIFQLRLN